MSKNANNLKRIAKDPLAIKRLQFQGDLREVPAQLAGCEHLEVLNLSYTDIRAIPDFIWELSKLHTLDLSGCGRLPFPDELLSCPHIHTLGIHARTQNVLHKGLCYRICKALV